MRFFIFLVAVSLSCSQEDPPLPDPCDVRPSAYSLDNCLSADCMCGWCNMTNGTNRCLGVRDKDTCDGNWTDESNTEMCRRNEKIMAGLFYSVVIGIFITIALCLCILVKYAMGRRNRYGYTFLE